MAKSQEDGTTILLGLRDYRVEGVVGSDKRVLVKVGVKGKEERCHSCGSASLYGHGMCKPKEVLHTWTNGKKVCLEFHCQRWKCRNYEHTFTEGKGLVRKRSRLTRQAKAEALRQLKER